MNQPPGITLIGYADDLAIVGVAKTEDSLQPQMNMTIQKTKAWIQSKRLYLLEEKDVEK